MKKTTALMVIAIALAGCNSGSSEPSQGSAGQGAAGSKASRPEDDQAPGQAVKRGQPAPPDVAGPPADAEKSKSGLAWKVLEKGSGSVHPGPYDKVSVHYTGWTTDGEMFDTSMSDGQPVEFMLFQVIPGWTEGLQLMVPGEKRRFWIPEELAYKGQRGAPQGMLVFDVNLLKVEPNENVPAVPEDVSAPPANAEKTASGLASRVLQKGTGTTRPTADSVVKVHYSGWTTDGQMFDSSVIKNRPAVFPLSKVIKGWTEGVQLMVTGEKRRFWIPEELAYKGRPNRPQGMLVFDVELLEILQ